jgi:hypothetical protein
MFFCVCKCVFRPGCRACEPAHKSIGLFHLHSMISLPGQVGVKAVPGVQSCAVSLVLHQAEVVYTSASSQYLVVAARLSAVITGLGFDSTLLSTSPVASVATTTDATFVLDVAAFQQTAAAATAAATPSGAHVSSDGAPIALQRRRAHAILYMVCATRAGPSASSVSASPLTTPRADGFAPVSQASPPIGLSDLYVDSDEEDEHAVGGLSQALAPQATGDTSELHVQREALTSIFNGPAVGGAGVRARVLDPVRVRQLVASLERTLQPGLIAIDIQPDSPKIGTTGDCSSGWDTLWGF